MLKFKLFLILILLPILLDAQKEDFIWVFGYNSPSGAEGRGPCVLDFNHEPPLAYEQEREMNLDVSVASNCDENGDLLLYTNGIYIANHEHELIENGDSLNPGDIAFDYIPQGYPVFQSAILHSDPTTPDVHTPVSYTHLTLPTTPYV